MTVTTLIVPYRDRPKHLRALIETLVPLCAPLSIQIVIAELDGRNEFNKGALLNAAVKHVPSDYYIFNDVDCSPHPESMRMYDASTLDDNSVRCIFTSIYKRPIMPIVLISRANLEKCNGLTPCFTGWGAEDSDFGNRVRHFGLHVEFNQFRDKRTKVYDGFSVFDDDTDKVSEWHSTLSLRHYNSRLKRRVDMVGRIWDMLTPAEKDRRLYVAGGLSTVDFDVTSDEIDPKNGVRHIIFDVRAENALIVTHGGGDVQDMQLYLSNLGMNPLPVCSNGVAMRRIQDARRPMFVFDVSATIQPDVEAEQKRIENIVYNATKPVLIEEALAEYVIRE